MVGLLCELEVVGLQRSGGEAVQGDKGPALRPEGALSPAWHSCLGCQQGLVEIGVPHDSSFPIPHCIPGETFVLDLMFRFPAKRSLTLRREQASTGLEGRLGAHSHVGWAVLCPSDGVFAPAGLSMLRSQSSTRTRQRAARSPCAGRSQAWRRTRSG